jgi:hypothetical protein
MKRVTNRNKRLLVEAGNRAGFPGGQGTFRVACSSTAARRCYRGIVPKTRTMKQPPFRRRAGASGKRRIVIFGAVSRSPHRIQMGLVVGYRRIAWSKEVRRALLVACFRNTPQRTLEYAFPKMET